VFGKCICCDRTSTAVRRSRIWNLPRVLKQRIRDQNTEAVKQIQRKRIGLNFFLYMHDSSLRTRKLEISGIDFAL
jgi:hypothetical protein